MIGLAGGSAESVLGGSASFPLWFYHIGDATCTNLPAAGIGIFEPRCSGRAMSSGANLINSDGQVVGETTAGSATDAAIWDSTNGVRDLNTVFSAYLAKWSAENNNATVVLNDAQAINDKDVISGVATINGTANQVFVLSPLPGDANLDGKVDINDLTIVLNNYGQAGMTWGQGEFTGSGQVDINDLTIVLSNYGQSLGAGAGNLSAVPEPSALVLIGAAAAGLLAFAWRKRLAPAK
jgi:hypothetical protein